MSQERDLCVTQSRSPTRSARATSNSRVHLGETQNGAGIVPVTWRAQRFGFPQQRQNIYKYPLFGVITRLYRCVDASFFLPLPHPQNRSPKDNDNYQLSSQDSKNQICYALQSQGLILPLTM
jgi:hypothetical protein